MLPRTATTAAAVRGSYCVPAAASTRASATARHSVVSFHAATKSAGVRSRSGASASWYVHVVPQRVLAMHAKWVYSRSVVGAGFSASTGSLPSPHCCHRRQACVNHRKPAPTLNAPKLIRAYPTRFHTPAASSRAFAMIAASSSVVSRRSFISTTPLAIVCVTCAPSTPKMTCHGRLPVVNGVGGA